MDPWFGIEQEYTLMRRDQKSQAVTLMICCVFFAGNEIRYPNLYTLIIAIVSGSHHQPNSTMECNKGFDVWSLFVFEKIRARSWTVSTLLHADFCWVIKETPGKNGMHVANSTAKALEKWWLEDYTPESWHDNGKATIWRCISSSWRIFHCQVSPSGV